MEKTLKEVVQDYLLENEWENVGVDVIGDDIYLTLYQKDWIAPIRKMAQGLIGFLAGDFTYNGGTIGDLNGKTVSITLEFTSN